MESRRNVWLVCTAAVALSSGAAVPAQQGSPSQPPAFRSGVELVMVDVGIVDRQGRPVAGLTPRDFAVSVAGQPRKVVSAEFVDVTAARAATARDPGPAHVSTNQGAGLGRQFVFIVDQNTMDVGSVRFVAKAAARFFDGLTFVDRSALMLMPTGPNLNFTWAHDRVEAALQRVTGLASPIGRDEFPSLAEARDIAARNPFALRMAAQRECGGGMSASAASVDPFGGGAGISGPSRDGPGPTSSPGGSTQGGDSGGSGQGGSSGGGQPSGGSSGGSTGSAPRSTAAPGIGRGDNCTRDLQMRAEFAWRNANMTSLASLTALRQVFDALARVPGDKTVVLISGGWPLEEREQTSMLTLLADEAAAARATLFTLFTPSTMPTAARRTISHTPTMDQQLYSWPLEMLAGMTGGGSYRADVGAEGAFERLSRELSGYYRLGVEKEPGDGDGKGRRMKVQVSRGGVTIRARSLFDSRTFEDRNWAGRLAAALEGPIPATAVGMKVTSYLSIDDDPRRMKLMLAGEATRVDPGEATVQVVVRDMEGKRILAGEQPLGEPTGDGLFFSTHIPIEPGRYVVRVAIIDGAGRVGSVDHRVDVTPAAVGPYAANGPLLVRVPSGQDEQPRVVLTSLRQDERLAVQVDVDADREEIERTGITFEIMPAAGGTPLLSTNGVISPGARSGHSLVQAVADVRVLPPGDYVMRARFSYEALPIGELRRPFTLLEGVKMAAVSPAADTTATAAAVPRPSLGTVARIPRFAVEQVMAPDVRSAFLDRVAARPDAASPMLRDLIARARTGEIESLFISETLAAEYPVAAFLKGLSLLSQQQIEPAAQAFRRAMRASADFYPAMVYLGACYAAGGNDKEAAGAWRTALIKEADTPALHLLLGEALLRQSRGDIARQTLEAAHARWPEDADVKRRYVVAALQDGQTAVGLRALDELVSRDAADEPALAAGLLILYEAFTNGRPIESREADHERMSRFAEAYKARGGPSLPLIEAWLAAAASTP